MNGVRTGVVHGTQWSSNRKIDEQNSLMPMKCSKKILAVTVRAGLAVFPRGVAGSRPCGAVRAAGRRRRELRVSASRESA